MDAFDDARLKKEGQKHRQNFKGRATNCVQFALGNSADAISAEVGVFALNAAQTAEVLVALFLPLGDQRRIRHFVLQTVLVQR
jgi:hypothetical protein